MCVAAVSDTPARSSSFCGHLELAHKFERLVTLCDFLHRQIAQTLQTECFHAEAGQHASVNHRSAQIVEVHRLHCPSEISGHAAGKSVPRPGRIVNVFQRVGATAKELVSLAKKQCAMLAFFYRNVLRPHLSDATPGFDEARLFCDFARFAVVQDKKIHTLKERIQVWSCC